MPPDARARSDCGDWQLECGQLRERGARLLASAQWADCSFLVGAGGAGGARGVPVRAHRLILAMASPVFQAMFYGPVAEGDAPIPVPDIQPDVFAKLLQYVYTDDVHLEDYKMAFEVYYAAEKYMLPHLQTLCTAYLYGNLVPQNACGIYEFANFIEDEKLEDDSLKVIKEKTKLALSSDSSFADLTLGTVIHIFSLDRLTIDSELDLLAAAERYVLACQERESEMSDTSSSDIDPENVCATETFDKDTNEVDIVQCNGNSNGDIDNLDEKISNGNDRQYAHEATGHHHWRPIHSTPTAGARASSRIAGRFRPYSTHRGQVRIAENQEITTSDTKPPLSACAEVVNRARSEATFRFTFNNVSNMEDRAYSSPFYVRNLPWKIWVRPKDYNGQKYLGFYVQCNGESKSITWSCEARPKYRLISQKPNVKPFCRKLEHRLFNSSSKSWGYPRFVTWNEVLDPKKGYVKDDAITLEVRVVAEPSQGLSWHSRGCIGDVDIKDEPVQAILRKIRFLTLTGKELADYKPNLSLLTDQDILAIMMNIASTETEKPLPRGFSNRTSRRNL